MSDFEFFMAGAWSGALATIVVIIVMALCCASSRMNGPS